MLYDGSGTGKTYASRGPILWRMRVCKMQEWYTRHLICGEFARDLERDRVTLPPEAVWAILHGDGCVPATVKVSRKQVLWLMDQGLVCYAPDDDYGF